MGEEGYIAGTLVDFALEVFNTDIPDQLKAMVPKFLIDKIGLEISGAQFPWSVGTYRSVVAFPAQGRSTVVYHGDLISPEQAAFINATAGHAQDFDDTHVQARIHASGIMIPTAFAVGEQVGSTPQDVCKAFTLGMEIMTRLGFAIPGSHLKGFHTPDVAGPFGAALTTGLLLRLTKDQLVNAMGICGSFSGGVEEYTRTGGSVKRNLPGIAAIAGIKAALLAREGITGPPSILEGHHGICSVFDDGTHVAKITEKLGDEFVILNTSFKPYNCCYVIHSGLEAFVDICKEKNIRPEDIAKIEVGSSKFGVDHVSSIRSPRTAVEAQFSLSFMLALALINGEPGEYDVTDAVVKQENVQALANKISMFVDETAERERTENFGSIVKVTTNAGQHFEKRLRYSKGTPENPMTVADLENKFRKNLAPLTSSKKIDSLLELVHNFQSMNNIMNLTSMLTKSNLAQE